MAPANVHTLSKRQSTTLAAPIIVGIVAGVVAFFLILPLAWLLVWRRWKRQQVHKKQPQPVRRMSLDSKSSFDLPPGLSKIVPDPPLPSPKSESRYFSMLSSLQRSPLLRDSEICPPSLAPPSSRNPPGLATHSRPPSIDEESEKYTLAVPKRLSTRSALMRFKPSLSRSSSTTSASVYSVASAPISEHERILMQASLEPMPVSAPAWMASMPRPEMGAGASAPAPAGRVTGVRPLPPILIPGNGKTSQPAGRRLSAQVRKLPAIPDTASSNDHSRSLSMDLDFPVMAPTPSADDGSQRDSPARPKSHTSWAPALDISSFAAAGRSIMSFVAPASPAPSPAPSDSTGSTIRPWQPQIPPVAPLFIATRTSAVLPDREGLSASPPHVLPTLQAPPDEPAPSVPARSPMRGAFAV